MRVALLVVGLMYASCASAATVGIPYGDVKSLTYRGGWVSFKIVGEDGTNYCSSCPTDPGLQGREKCWIEETKNAQLSMILSAQARGKMIRGRISDQANCNVYEMTVQD